MRLFLSLSTLLISPPPHLHLSFTLALGDVPVVRFPLLGKKPAAIPLTARGNTIIIDVGRLKWEGVPNEVPAL